MDIKAAVAYLLVLSAKYVFMTQDACECSCSCKPLLYNRYLKKDVVTDSSKPDITSSTTPDPTPTCKSGHLLVKNKMSLDFTLCHEPVNNTIIVKFNYTILAAKDEINIELGFSKTRNMSNVEYLSQYLAGGVHQFFREGYYSENGIDFPDDEENNHHFKKKTLVEDANPIFAAEFLGPATTNDAVRDFQFSPDNCPYIVAIYRFDSNHVAFTDEKVCFMKN